MQQALSAERCRPWSSDQASGMTHRPAQMERILRSSSQFSFSDNCWQCSVVKALPSKQIRVSGSIFRVPSPALLWLLCSRTTGHPKPQTKQFSPPERLLPQIVTLTTQPSQAAIPVYNGLPSATGLGKPDQVHAIETANTVALAKPVFVASPQAAMTSVKAATAKVLLNTVDEFANLLQPTGFQRDDWQSFAHIKLKEKRAKRATLSPVPALTKVDIQDADEDIFTILIDPGHGGWDPGSIAHNGLKEKDLTLDIARRVELFLSEVPDINVVLTRRGDISLRRKARVHKIKNSKTDLVVSLHFNHLPESNVNLVESFYAGPEDIAESQKLMQQANSGGYQQVAHGSPTDLSFTRGSKRLAKMMHKRVFDEVSLDNSKVIDAGVKTDMLYVLTQSFTPGVLMELTCISNIEEADRLADENYRNRLAAALADGIRNYRESLRTNPINGTGA